MREISTAIDMLLQGAIDLDCCNGSLLTERPQDHVDAAREAEAAGLGAMLLQHHDYSPTPIVQTLKLHEFASSRLRLVSGVVLNNAVGGLNPYAVEHELMLGGRVISMPTLSAANHLRTRPPRPTPTTRPMRQQTELQVTDASGKLLDEVLEILDLIAQYDAVLSAGHLHIDEIQALFAEAGKRGVRRLLVNQPDHIAHACLADIADLASLGVFMIPSAAPIDGGSEHIDVDALKAFIAEATVQRTILGSASSPTRHPNPVDGFRATIRLMLELGYSDTDIGQMVSGNARRLLGLDEPQGRA